MYTQRDRRKHETVRRDRVHHVHPERQREESMRQRGDRVHHVHPERERKARDREERQSTSCTPRETERGKHETEMRDREAEESMRQRGETEYIIYTQRDRERKAQDRWGDGVHYV